MRPRLLPTGQGITWLWLLNFVVLQWLCIRLARVVKGRDDQLWQTGWTVLRFPAPLTSWWTPYRYLNRKHR